jgi:DNA-binding MarR family transcriptional regulator
MYDQTVKARDLNDHIQAVMRRMRVVDAVSASSPTHQLGSRHELYVIEYLGSHGPCIMSDLARYLMVALNTVTNVIDRLVSKGFVRRERSEVNRRKVWVHLTPDGEACYQAHLAEHLEIAKTLLSALNPDEQDIFLVLMRKIGRAANLSRNEADAG